MNSWPKFVAALGWLCELIRYHEEVESVLVEKQAESDSGIFFEYLTAAYFAFLSGDDDEYEEIDNQLKSLFNARLEDLAKDKDVELERASELRSELDKLRDEESTIPELEEKIAKYNDDIEKYTTLLRNWSRKKTVTEQRLEKTNAIRDSRTAALEELNAQKVHEHVD